VKTPGGGSAKDKFATVLANEEGHRSAGKKGGKRRHLEMDYVILSVLVRTVVRKPIR